jgi:hypothetical protein
LRRTTSAVLGAAAALVLWSAPSAHASPGVCAKSYTVRVAVIKTQGKRAPGRNICRFGVKLSNGKVIDANYSQKKRYLLQLRKLIASRAYLSVRAAPPAQPPAGTLSARYAPSGLAACIVRSESGGNPRAVNGQYSGIAQWSPEAWARMGGTRYASSPTGASYQEQLTVLNDGLSKYGCRDWCPYDPC